MSKGKQKQPTSNNKPVYRKPIWSATSRFEISGEELEALANMANQYRPLVALADRLILMGEISGDIANEYVYADGTVASDKNENVVAAKQDREQFVERTKQAMQNYQETLRKQMQHLEDKMTIVNSEKEIENPEVELTNDEGKVIPLN